METQEKIRIMKESFERLRARRIVKTLGDFADQKIRAWSHTPGSFQIFIQIPCSGKNRGSVTKLAIILHPQNIDGSIHPPPVQP